MECSSPRGQCTGGILGVWPWTAGKGGPLAPSFKGRYFSTKEGAAQPKWVSLGGVRPPGLKPNSMSSQQRGKSLPSLSLCHHLETGCVPSLSPRGRNQVEYLMQTLSHRRHPAFSFSRQQDSDGGAAQALKNGRRLPPSPFSEHSTGIRCRREPAGPHLRDRQTGADIF